MGKPHHGGFKRILRLPRNFNSSAGTVGCCEEAIAHHENLHWPEDSTAIARRQHYHLVMEQNDDDESTHVDTVISAPMMTSVKSPSPRETHGSEDA